MEKREVGEKKKRTDIGKQKWVQVNFKGEQMTAGSLGFGKFTHIM